MLFRDIYVYDKASFLIKGKIKFGIVIISRERVSQDNDRGGISVIIDAKILITI